MKIVCPLSQVEQMVAAHAPERVVSLLDPGFEFPEPDRHSRAATFVCSFMMFMGPRHAKQRSSL